MTCDLLETLSGSYFISTSKEKNNNFHKESETNVKLNYYNGNQPVQRYFI